MAKTTFFLRVWVDLMQFNPALNSYEWAIHIACISTNFNIVNTNHAKLRCCQFILNTIIMIKHCFNWDVVFIQLNNKRAFSNAFRDELKNISITFETNASDTPAQNWNAECKHKMLAVKARAFCIGADFFHQLWVEAIHTAYYLAN